MRIVNVALVLAILASAGAAVAQSTSLPGNLGEAASSALDSLKSAGKDKLLVADMIGHEVTGPSGDKVGTVTNLVAIPGGRIVAVILSLEDGSRLPVPYQLMKISSAQESLGITLPMSVDELKANATVKDMSNLLSL